MGNKTKIKDYTSIDELPETFLSKEEILITIFNMCKNYEGNADKLKDSIGILMISQLYGYKVVKLVWNRKLIKEVEEIIGKKLELFSLEETLYSDRSLGLRFLKKSKEIINNFEKAFNDIIYSRREKPADYKIISTS